MHAAAKDDRGDSTRCVHAGRRPTPGDPGLMAPIVRSSTFLQHAGTRSLTAAGRWDDAWVYSRYGNPTVAAVESRLAALEGAQGALLFGSGSAALHAALLAAAGPGGAVAMPSQIYGGTRAILAEELVPLGLRLVEFDLERPEALATQEHLDVIVVESLTNPNLLVADLPGLAQLARGHGARLVVDATFATPLLQRPLDLGADLVVHSATKALGGHSDLTAGVVAGGGELLTRVREIRKHLGAVLDPAPAALIERGIKTLALRLRAQAAGAQAVAEALEGQAAVRAVHYPGLASHPHHARCQELLRGFGGVLSFELAAGDEALLPFAARLRLVIDAPSLGGVETLISLPATMSHAGMSPEERLRAGVVPGLVRVAVGIEDPEDLVADFLQALEA
ncbi:MAG: aminotransferase class I/II-fold pyridoxal phosphate-dependent enzyme [Planctomycetota bacterium]|nr:aminotransferase class I/II-fold pyridoxal phosphate-dependent enzyme [Planctomycetota bacterium]